MSDPVNRNAPLWYRPNGRNKNIKNNINTIYFHFTELNNRLLAYLLEAVLTLISKDANVLDIKLKH